jgi:tetratricopeptide (TPR) repeat protein
MGLIATAAAVARAVIASTAAVAPWAKRLRAELFAGRTHGLGGTQQTEERLDEALSRLGAPQESDAWWKQAATYLQAVVVRPDHFNKPHVKQWLNRSITKRALKAHVLDLHFSRTPSDESYEALLSSYSSITGEGRQHATSIVDFAISFLRASLEGGMRDPELTELIQEGHHEQSGKLTNLADKVDALTAAVDAKLIRPTSPLIAAEAERELQRILRRRMSPGQSVLTEMQDLWAALGQGGKYEFAPDTLRAEVLFWLARIHASNENYSQATQLVAKLRKMSLPIPDLLEALLQYANGERDASIRIIRSVDTKEGRSLLLFLLVRIKGNDSAASHFLSQEPLHFDFFTAHGWRSYISLLLAVGKFAEAENAVGRLPDEVLKGCTDLHLLAGLLESSRLVPNERRRVVVDHGLAAFGDGVLDGPEATQALRRAIRHFAQCLERAEADEAPKLAQQCRVWMRALRLLDKEFRPSEVLALQADMANGKDAIRWVQLASRLDVPFDAAPLESYLARQQVIGGLSNDELIARLEILRVKGPAHAYVSFLEEQFEQLSSAASRGAIAIELIQALCHTKQAVKAADLLPRFRADIGDDAARVQLMIDHAMGEDPSAKAIEIFRDSGLIGDLANVVNSLELRRRWSDLAPFALELFNRQPNASTASTYANALRKAAAPAQELAAFLDRAAQLVALPPDLFSTRAWSLYLVGDHQRAKEINDDLLRTREDANDFGLDVNLAVQTGDWDRFPELLAQARERSATLPARTLIAISHLAGSEGPTQAFQLAQEAVTKEPDDANVLVSAYGIAVAAGRDRDAAEWMQRAIKLSKPDGPVQAYSFAAFLELMKANREAWGEKNEKFRKAEVPLHFAASMFNVPLAHLLLGIPRANRLTAEARHRQPIPIWSGARKSPEGLGQKTIALDATSVFVLHDLDLLTSVLSTFEAVYISPGFFGFLLHERQRAVFHQPSRIAAAKPLLALLHRGLIQVVRRKPEPHLEKEIGLDSASVLTEAKAKDGWFIHSGPLYKLASYREVLAEVGEHAPYVSDVSRLANWLADQGHITPAVRDSAQRYFKEIGCAQPIESNAAAGDPENGVFLDGPTIQYLADAELLMPLISAAGAVFVHESLVSEWEALVDMEPTSADTVRAITTIRNELRRGLLAGEVKFLQRNQVDAEEKFGLIESGLLDLLGVRGQADAVCLDDRMLNTLARVGEGEGEGRGVPLLTSADLIEHLIIIGKLNVARRRELHHRMREGCLYCVPVNSNDLEELITIAPVADGLVRETAELRVLRQYLARLHSSDVLCTPADLHYLDGLWRVGTIVIDKLWGSDAVSSEDASVKSSWVLNHVIPDIAVAMAYADKAAERMSLVAAERALHVLVAGMTYGNKSRAYMEWLQQTWLFQYLPGARNVLDTLVDRTAAVMIQQCEDLGNE